MLVAMIKANKINSVGIATLNIFQRNIILEKIRGESFSIKEFGEVFDEMTNKKNFFVKNLENIQGDEKDVIIISTTFGKNNSGYFRQNFGPLNTAKGYKLLNVIITRAKYQLFVCTSIPPENYLNYAEEIEAKGNSGKGIFYAYLAYAQSIEDNNEKIRSSILALLKSKCQESYNRTEQFVESPFEEEVLEYLSEYIERERIQIQYECGGFRIDMVVFPEDSKKKPIAIECDVATYHSNSEAYSWDIFRQKQLEENGFIFYRVWSTNWWENPELETKRLVEFISNNH